MVLLTVKIFPLGKVDTDFKNKVREYNLSLRQIYGLKDAKLHDSTELSEKDYGGYFD